MNPPVFLEVDELVEINRDQIARHGGIHTVRDVGALEATAAAPRFVWYYEEGVDLFRLAAIYMARVIRAHPFLDGNKRTGVKAGLVFLAINGAKIKLRSRMLRELEDLAVAVACCEAGEENVAAWLRFSLG